MSVSTPFFTLSVQVAPWQTLPEQTELVQSVGRVQLLPGVQRLHDVAPPQSTALSPPFSMPSVQVAVWHVTLHEPLSQSEPETQTLPGGQPGQVPPQSWSVSEPFFVLSMQLGCWPI